MNQVEADDLLNIIRRVWLIGNMCIFTLKESNALKPIMGHPQFSEKTHKEYKSTLISLNVCDWTVTTMTEAGICCIYLSEHLRFIKWLVWRSEFSQQ